MRFLFPVLVALLLVTAAEAKRARRTPVNTPTGVTVDQQRLEPWGSGFAVFRNSEGKGEVVAYDADGENPKVLAAAAAPIVAWSPSPKEDSLAWLSAGKIHVRATPDGKDREWGDAEAIRPTFSRDGKVVAFVAKGSLVLRDLEGERRREIAPRQNRRIEGIEFTGDGKWLMAVTAPVVMDAESFADTIERLDASAEAPGFEAVHTARIARIRSACVSPTDDHVAFLEWTREDAKPVLRILPLGSGLFHDLTDTGDFRELAFAADGRWLMMNLGGVVHTQQLFQSGSVRSFYREILTVGEGRADSRPVSGKGGMWFLRAKTGAFEVVKSVLE